MKHGLIGLAGLLWLTASLAHGHELKVLASQFLTEPGERVTVYLSWGHLLPVDDLIDAKTIERYELIAPNGQAEPLETAGLTLQANAVELEEAGIYQAVAARKPTLLTYVIDSAGNRVMKRGPRSAIKEGKIDSSQRSRQFAKAVLVSGTPGQAAVKPLGLPLEIVPADAPAAWQAGSELRFKVLLDGKPLADAPVLASYVGHRPAGAWSVKTTTDRDGLATVRAATPGTWVLKVQHRQPAASNADYDLEALTSTLALEVRP